MSTENNNFYLNIGLRIKNKREEKGYSYQELSVLTGISKSSLQRYETGNTKKIPMDAVNKLESALSLKTGYLMGWESGKEEIKREIDKKTIAIRSQSAPPPDSPLVFKEPKREIFIDKMFPVRGDFSIIAPDDSMQKARINKGDVVFLDSEGTPQSGDIVLISYKGKFLLKHYYLSAGYWTFSSAEVFDAPVLSQNLEADGIEILGKAVAFQSIL